jgi:hypothetical protein
LGSPWPRGQLESEKLPPFPAGGGVGVGRDGSVVGGVDEEGELPPPQDEARRAMKLAATAATGIRLWQASIERVPP